MTDDDDFGTYLLLLLLIAGVFACSWLVATGPRRPVMVRPAIAPNVSAVPYVGDH